MKTPKKILLACEESQIVCKAFREKGHEAYSCDLLPCSGGHPEWHIQGDVLDIINDGWDMGIFFPPCTYLSYAGMANWYDEGRAMKRIKAAEFFMQLWESPIEKICLENPQGVMSQIFRKPDMVIHPYYFGDRDMKRTGLWLKNLPKLYYQIEDDLFGKKTATQKPKPTLTYVRKKTGKIKKSYWHDAQILMSGYERSKTFPGIAAAMAEQWGNLE